MQKELGMKQKEIPFNKPWFTGREAYHVSLAVTQGKISGNGIYTTKTQEYFMQRYGFGKALLTHSCTGALEMAAILADIQPGDEVIMPSFTFVSTANAFVLRGAHIIFADCLSHIPNIDISTIEQLISSRTKAIVVVHYAGIACDMDPIMELAAQKGITVIEDAAHSIDSYYKGRPLGSIGHMATFSFHETKNITCGEGGMLVMNTPKFFNRSEIIWEKGTNRAAFYRGEVDTYGWVDIGSSFLPSDLAAAFLFGQLEMLDDIQKKRVSVFNQYYRNLKPLEEKGLISLPHLPAYATCNGHLFYLVARNIEERTGLLGLLKENGVQAVFHYLPLHNSPFYASRHDGRKLPNSQRFSDCLLRLPLFYEITGNQVDTISSLIVQFFSKF